MAEQQLDESREAWRERIRRELGMIVHRPERQIPFVPTFWVTNVTDVRELLGRCEVDDDQDRDGSEIALP